MESKTTNSRRLLWAVDPFCDQPAILRSAAWALRGLSRGVCTETHPVYIWRTQLFDLPVEPVPSFQEKVRTTGEAELTQALRRIRIPAIKKLHVIATPSASNREAARALIEYAKETGAELIVASSRGRTGIKRIFLGSFVETLMLYSDIPLFVVRPVWRRVPEFKQILFATDFSDESKEAYTKALDFAEQRKSQITIFHRAIFPIHPGWTAFDFVVPPYSAYERAYEAGIIAAGIEAERMANAATSRGLRAKVFLDRTPSDSIADAILRKARKLDALIALVSRTGPVASVFAGSTTRQVVRYATNPVWVIHPDRKSQVRAKPIESEEDVVRHGEPRKLQVPKLRRTA